MVENESFRRDLFYRINVIKLTLPPLRERKEDIPLLLDNFVQRFNSLYNRKVLGVSDQAMKQLMQYSYPGNIRELENIIEYAFVLCSGQIIEPEHLPEHIWALDRKDTRARDLLSSVQEAEATAIMKALEENDYNRQQTARALGMHKSTLYRKMARYGLQLPKQNGRRKG
jgi:transcriptional regulator with PAS, ATPase and Fis domain